MTIARRDLLIRNRDFGAAMAEIDRLDADRSALLSLLIRPFPPWSSPGYRGPGSGWMARIPWRIGGYNGGVFHYDGGVTRYWFQERREAVAAVMEAARELAEEMERRS